MSRTADELDRYVRRLDPVDASGLTSAWSTSDAKRQLLQEVMTMSPSTTVEASREVAPSPSGWPRKRLVLGIAAVLLMLGSGAIASGIFQPDPEDVRTIVEHAEPDYDGGEVPVLLDTSGVWCAYENGLIGVSSWHDLGVGDEMTRQHLIAACEDGPDQVHFDEVPMPAASTFTPCEALVSAEQVERYLDAVGEQVIEGRLAGDRPVFPLVLGWDADCAGTTISDARLGVVELRPLSSLASFNRAREAEISLQAQAISDCLTLEQVLDLARDAAQRLDGSWVITDTVDTSWRDGVACFSGVRMDQVRGVLSVAGWGG